MDFESDLAIYQRLSTEIAEVTAECRRTHEAWCAALTRLHELDRQRSEKLDEMVQQMKIGGSPLPNHQIT